MATSNLQTKEEIELKSVVDLLSAPYCILAMKKEYAKIGDELYSSFFKEDSKWIITDIKQEDNAYQVKKIAGSELNVDYANRWQTGTLENANKGYAYCDWFYLAK